MSALTYGQSAEGVWIRFSACTRTPAGWKEELAAAARSIAEKARKPIWICSSGGLDSEIACRAFYDQGLHFSVLTLEYEDGANRYEMRRAVEWCRERGVTQKIVPFDMRSFLDKGMYAYADRYPAIHPFRYLQLRLLETVEEMGGYAVICSDDQLYRPREDAPSPPSSDDLILQFSNGTLIPFSWCRDMKTDHEPYFHFATPELCRSYLEMPLISFALAHPEAVFTHRHNVHFLKTLVYLSAWPDVSARRPSDGFDQLRGELRDAHKKLQVRFGLQHVPISIPVRDFHAQLEGRLTAA